MIISFVKDGNVEVIGGHLIEGNVTYVMVELAIGEIKGLKMIRKLHPERKSLDLFVEKEVE